MAGLLTDQCRLIVATWASTSDTMVALMHHLIECAPSRSVIDIKKVLADPGCCGKQLGIAFIVVTSDDDFANLKATAHQPWTRPCSTACNCC